MAIGTKNELIHCENCGEDYSATYKRCPFCDEAGGRRRNTRGGGYGGAITPNQVIAMIVSLALIGAAVWIVFSAVYPLVRTGEPGADPSLVDPSPAVSPLPSVSPNPADPNVTAGPEDPDASPDPNGPEETLAPPIAGSVTAVKLNRSDFTLSGLGESFRMTATLTPADARATITWITADDSIVRVSADGVVTAVGNGTTKITAQAAAGVSAECVVRVTNQATTGGNGSSSSSSGGESSGGSTSTPNSGNLSISKTDVSITPGESFTLKINGASSVTWTTTDSSKATVSADGNVTGVGAGRCVIQGTVNGEVYECIVRVRS